MRLIPGALKKIKRLFENNKKTISLTSLVSQFLNCLYFTFKFGIVTIQNRLTIKARIRQCDLSDRFFCILARSLCKFLSDEIRANKSE